MPKSKVAREADPKIVLKLVCGALGRKQCVLKYSADRLRAAMTPSLSAHVSTRLASFHQQFVHISQLTLKLPIISLSLQSRQHVLARES